MRFIISITLSCLLAACGEDDDNTRPPTPCRADPGVTSAGGGNETLEVLADLTYSLADDRVTTDIEVRRNGAVTAGASVRLTDVDTSQEFAIPETGSGDATRYRGLLPGYRQRLKLDVVYAADVIDGTIEGPSTHTVTSPAEGVTYSIADFGGSMPVEWAPADTVCVTGINIELGVSSFSTSIAANAESYDLPTSNLSTGAEEVHVIRSTSVDLAGGIVGGASYLRFSYDASNNIVLHP